MLSLVLSAEPNLAPFVGTLVGGGAALLLRSRLRTIELAQETEELRGQAAWFEQRTHVARELHDVVGHLVTAIVVQAEAGQVSDPDRALRSIGDLGRTALGELDALVVHLRDPSAALTVSAPPRLLDIEELLAEPLRRQGVAVSVRLEAGAGPGRGGRAHRLPDRAGGADQRGPPRPGERMPGSSWTGSATSVRLRVSDDGVGPAHVPGRDSGLLGIEERVSARGGTWAIGERPGGGTVLDVHLPVGAVMTGTTIRVAVVDDQQLVRDGFALILGSQPDIEVVVQAEDGRQFLEAVRADPRLDVALVDIRMPVLDGLAATRALAAVPHAPAVIVVTTFDDDAYVLDAIAAGARGFLLKRCSGRALVEAVRTVAAGESILSTEVTEAVLARVRAAGPAVGVDLAPYALTAREVDVLVLIGAGSTTPRSPPGCTCR